MAVRRLRDAGLSPWLVLMMLIPVIGTIALIVIFCRPSRCQHEDKKSGFNAADIFVTTISVILLIAEPAISTMAASRSPSEWIIQLMVPEILPSIPITIYRSKPSTIWNLKIMKIISY